ncbi:ARM repeat-containing protein [Atractiella rhizophila]|nr:ARM repeat-containing protein [Atractiella rhizophila]
MLTTHEEKEGEHPIWKKRLAALGAIGAMADGCGGEMSKNLDKIMGLVLPMLDDENVRVRHGAIYALAELCSDLPGKVQQSFAEPVLNALVAVYKTSSHRIKRYSLSALVNFIESATPEILGPFLGGLLQHLVNAFNTGDEYLQEAALNVISSMAEVAGPAFRDFYPALAPLLFAVVEDKHQNLHMKAKALQTATCIAACCDISTAHQSSVEQMGHSLLDLLQNLHHTEEETETLRIVLTSFGQLAQALGAHNFKPYLPQLLPILLENAAVRPDVSLTAKDEADETEEEEGWIYLDVQGQQVGVQTTHLEAKSHALDTLKTIGAVVGNGMQPWLDQLVDICVPLLKFYFDEGIRLASIQMIPILVAGYKDENSEVDNFQVNYINRLFKGLADLIQIENDPAILVELLQAWLASFLAFPHAISTSQVELMSKALKVQLKEVIIRADLERVELQAEGCPKSAEDGQPSEFMVAYELNRCLRELLRYQPDGFKLDEFLTNLTLATREEPYLRLFALRLMCDLIEFTGPACFSAISEYLPLLLAGIQDSEPFTRRVCSYGIGMMAAFGGDPFRPVAESTIPVLLQTVSLPPTSEFDVLARDNAVSALAKLIRQGIVDPSDNKTIAAWVLALPIEQDSDEMDAVWGLLLELIIREHPTVDPQASPTTGLHIVNSLYLAYHNPALPALYRDSIAQGLRTYITKFQDPTAAFQSLPDSVKFFISTVLSA